MFRRRTEDRLGIVLLALTLSGLGVLALIVAFLFKESAPVLKTGLLQLVDLHTPWHPMEGQFGMGPMLIGSVLCTALALALAIPFGIASALFMRYHGATLLVRPFRWVLCMLAGIPSVVLGLWGLTVLVPLVAAWQPPGASLLLGAVILALMILPTIALTAEAAFVAVPSAYVDGAHALGLQRSAIALRVVLPAARKGITAGIALACARALGETMAVLMVTGNVVQVPSSLFDPMRTLTANIALEMAYATSNHRASLFFSGLVLTAVVMGVALLAHRHDGPLPSAAR